MDRLVGGAAALAGYCVRLVLAVLRLAPWFLIIYGVWQFDYRVALILAGVVGLLPQASDRRKA